MTQRPLVHIGFHKTATTWFQKAFYPRVANGRYVARKQVQTALLAPDAFSFDAAGARRTLGADGERLLLCEENLSGYPHNGGLGGLAPLATADRLRQALPDAQIVIFIREQAAMLAACHAQYVRSGGTRSARDYMFPPHAGAGALSKWYKAPRFNLRPFEYLPLIEAYAARFGREAVHVFLYEDFAADRMGFLQRYAARLDLEVDLPGIEFDRRNRSLSPAGIDLMRRLNLFTPGAVLDKTCLLPIPRWYKRRWTLARLLLGGRLEASASPEARLGSEAVLRLHAHFARSNARLEASWDLPLARFGYAVAERTAD